MSPRAARRGGRAERKSPGPNTTLSLWGEPGQPEGYDPGAPTGPLETAELGPAAVGNQQRREPAKPAKALEEAGSNLDRGHRGSRTSWTRP